MDVVLGMSLAPKTVRMVLVEGENADGGTVEEDNFELGYDDAAPTMSASDRVITAILGTREGATEAGYALASTGVTWTDPAEAAALRAALATRKIENVMLVSAFLAAAALAQAVGSATGNAHTALLFLEPDTATLAIVDTADGSITDVHKELISSDDTADLAEMVARLNALEPRPEGVFVVGSGVDTTAVKTQVETLTSLPVSAPDEPETALAWGAALASAHAPAFASSTAALAYAQDPGTGAIDPYAVSPGYLAVSDVPPGTELGEEDLAYSAVPDEEAEINTATLDLAGEEHADGSSERRPLLLVGTVLAVAVVAAVLALEVSLALGIRPSAVSLLPRPLQNLLVPTQQAPAPAPAPASAPVPQINHLQAPVVSPPLNAPLPAPRPAAPPPAPVPAAPPAPVVVHPAPVPVPVPVAIPVVPPVQLPAPQPVHLPVPIYLPAPQPVHQPVPIHLPSPQPVQLPEPQPVQLPLPVHQPSPQPVQLPEPQPVQLPQPVHQPAPVHLPVPVYQPTPQPVQMPEQPPFAMPAPQAPVHVPGQTVPDAPAPQAPWHIPAPEAPAAPRMPAPDSPPALGPFSPSGGDNGPHGFGGGANGPGTDSSFGPFGGNHGGGGGLGGFGGSPGGPGGPGGFGGFGGHGFGGLGGGGFGGGHGGFGGFGGHGR